ncbi:unnamed protein product [Nesidiocoris tenuis]|uniref:Uncharacterized protein n=1 Tax=Nesidiocoris tenuis TaxID=355587 RepID=A0A6H5G0T4_9HEMI|nr:unnamed protein product [Nesidiocoris tenuis]
MTSHRGNSMTSQQEVFVGQTFREVCRCAKRRLTRRWVCRFQASEPNRLARERRSASNQRRDLAKELIATAQQQLAALSKLKATKEVKSEQRVAKTRTPPRSCSSSNDGKRFKNILPNKSKFEYVQQMSNLLRLGREDGKIDLKPRSKTPSRNATSDEKSESLARRSFSQGREHTLKNSANSKKGSHSADREGHLCSPEREKGKRMLQAQSLPKPSLQKDAAHLSYMLEITDMLKASHQKMQGKKPASSSQRDSSNARSRSSSENRAKSNRKVSQNLLGSLPGPSGQQIKQAEPKKETVVQTMEQEVKSLQKELELVQAERRGLALQKKLLQCMADSGPSTGGGPSPMMAASRDMGCKDVETNQMSIPLQQMYQKPSENLSAVEMQLNSLREQYRKLQEDYNAKVEEVSMVRVEHESAKRDSLQLLEKCREAEARVDDLLERLRAIEMEKSKMAGSKDQMTELEQQLTLAKQRYREGQEELDEVRTTMQDQMIQLEEYRNKYLTAQQTVEEQRRQIDIMELENNRIGEQVNLEIQRVKRQLHGWKSSRLATTGGWTRKCTRCFNCRLSSRLYERKAPVKCPELKTGNPSTWIWAFRWAGRGRGPRPAKPGHPELGRLQKGQCSSSSLGGRSTGTTTSKF